MKKIAITGGLSSGKSSVCGILKRLGAYTVSADDIVHQLLSPSAKIGQKIVHLLGKEVAQGNQFDRSKIAKIVFNDKEALRQLEKILHPAVLEEIENQFNQVKSQKKFSLFVAEIPLLYESESHHLFDHVVAVVCNPEVAKKRFQQKTKLTEEDFDKRMMTQMSPSEKSAKADFTLTNNGDMAALETQVTTLYQHLTHQE